MTPQSSAIEAAKNLVDKVDTIIIFPIVTLMIAVSFLFFIYGSAVYIIKANDNTARAEGKKNITYGIIGMVVMVSAYALFKIAAGTFGLNETLDCASDPTQGGCEEMFQFVEPTE